MSIKNEEHAVSALYYDLGYCDVTCKKEVSTQQKYSAALTYILSLESELRARGVEL